MPRTLLVLALCLLPTLAWAQTTTAPAPASAALSDLASDTFDTRERATQALLADDRLTIDDIKRMYAASTLPEQRHRLLRVAHHHFVRRLIEQQFPVGEGERGSLGVSLIKGVGPNDSPEGADAAGKAAARIGLTYPGFPAYVWLRPGDLIVAVDGQPLPATDDSDAVQRRFVELVQARTAGQSLKLTVYREGQKLEVTPKLAPYNALRNLYEPSEVSLVPDVEGRWRAVRREIAASHPEPEALKPPLRRGAAVSPPEPPPPRVNQPADGDAEPVPMEE